MLICFYMFFFFFCVCVCFSALMGSQLDIPLVNVYGSLVKMALEFLDLPMKHVDVPYSYVSLPEGKC